MPNTSKNSTPASPSANNNNNNSNKKKGPATSSPSPKTASSSNNNDNNNAPRQSSTKLYKVLIMITIFGITTFFIAIFTDTDGHRDVEHIRKELILKDFLQKPGASSNNKNEQITKRSKTTVRQKKQQQQQPKVQKESSVTAQQQQQQQNNPNKNTNNSQHPPYHVVFSTSCNDQQHWESYVFFYHANKVKQPGTVTRIVSGCKKEESEWLREFHAHHIATMNSNFYVHFTPDFSHLTRFQQLGDKNAYKYMNKPYGLRDWMEKVLQMGQKNRPADVEDGIVFLMDPDNILLRPIVHDFNNEDMIFVKDKPDWKVVEHGHPIAQQDGYLNNQWMGLNISFVTHGGNIDTIKDRDGPQYWNTGPPYLATVRDMYNIAVLWTEYAPRVYHIHPKLFAEMFGFIIATTQLELPHTLIKSIVVSTTGTNVREGWPYIDALPDDQVCNLPSDARLPMGIHYCKRYLLEKWFFSKYRLKKKYISCETPLLASPPIDLAMKNWTHSLQPPPHGHQGDWDPPRKEMSPKQAKREAFMICALISLVNEAAIHYKTTACNGTANMSTNYTFFSDPNH